MGKLGNIIKSTWDCLRYPFLYPRNRFTGLHYSNWRILDWVKTKAKDSSIFVNLSLSEDEVLGPSVYWINPHKYLILEVKYQENEVWVILGGPGKIWERVVSKLKVPGKVLGAVWGESGVIKTHVYSLPKSPRFISSRIIHNHSLWWLSKFIGWFHSWPLQLLHCLPKYTELDALEKGWRKAFGESLCKDLRKSIIGESGSRGLFRFRVTQIKEKWGYLHFYYNGGGEKVRETISKYEEISEKTCICCGKPATWRTTGWISPYCDDCIEENDLYGSAERIEKEEGS